MTRHADTELDRRIAASWPVVVDDADVTPGGLRDEVRRRIADDPGSQPSVLEGVVPRRPMAPRLAIVLTVVVLVLGVTAVGTLVAQRRTGVAEPGAEGAPRTGRTYDDGELLELAREDPDTVVRQALAATRDVVAEAASQQSMIEIVADSQQPEAATVSIERGRGPDGDWSFDDTSGPAEIRRVDGVVYARTRRGVWLSLTDPPAPLEEMPASILDGADAAPDAVLDAAAGIEGWVPQSYANGAAIEFLALGDSQWQQREAVGAALLGRRLWSRRPYGQGDVNVRVVVDAGTGRVEMIGIVGSVRRVTTVRTLNAGIQYVYEDAPGAISAPADAQDRSWRSYCVAAPRWCGRATSDGG